MPSSFTDGVNLEKPVTGEKDNTWGTTLNANFDLVDKFLTGQLSKSVAGGSDITLTTSEAGNAHHKYTGTLTANINVIVPALNKVYLVENATAGAFTLTVKTSAGSGVAIEQGARAIVYCDGTDVVAVLPNTVLTAALDTNSYAINESEGSAVASAGETNIWATDGNTIHMTGTATITSLGTAPRVGARRRVIADAAATLVHDGTAINLPASANLVLAAGDVFEAYADTTTQIDVQNITLANGQPVVVDIVNDTTPQLGGDLDLNGQGLDFPTTPNITDVLDEDTMSSDSATALATQQSIKAYADSVKGLVPIERKTSTAVASYDFVTGINSTYRSYVLRGWLQPATDDVQLWLRTDANGGASFDAGASDYQYGVDGHISTSAQSVGSTGASAILIAGGTSAGQAVGNASGERVSFQIEFEAPSDTTYPAFTFLSIHRAANDTINELKGGGFRDTQYACDGVQLIFESGNIADGDVTLYGVVNS